ncbi:STAS domain-containing protein [Aquiflexum lacus]|uniref:STAS domain-containing protein n=1 Tax=Aquiflexum lacus TaxID=2483805 RepID=UPI0018958DBA|nr:STAS domain-containing protein [Aquiflexum lacus]
MLKIEKNIENDHSVLSLIGEIDASNSVELDEVILEMVQGGVCNILVDCSMLEYISSAGLGVFMSYLEEFQEKQITLVIFGLKEKVFQVFNILGLDQLIKIRDTKQDALDEIL